MVSTIEATQALDDKALAGRITDRIRYHEDQALPLIEILIADPKFLRALTRDPEIKRTLLRRIMRDESSMSIQRLAQFLNCSSSLIRKKMGDGTAPPRWMINTLPRFRVWDVLQWCDDQPKMGGRRPRAKQDS